MLPVACVAPQQAPPPANPFLGSWASEDKSQITFREDTVVLGPAEGGAAYDNTRCRGVFGFLYGKKSRDALAALITRQPDLRKKVTDLLPQPDYRVAELDCDQGDHTYVLLGDRDLLAIYRDGDIAGIDRLSRAGAGG